ncbi:MarR family winged helix-turn-helix transcriptional regulator [Emticicia soli]|uniref:MarR family winged helix-turn-helix transcriptional regulator n=1 Tax=Emticicia soli TaxID=2027878 RepID=A0ABW5JBY5_9BACT
MNTEQVTHLRRLSQQYAYSALQMHETIGRKAGLSGTDHKYLGFLIQKGAMTAGELANLTGLTTGAVTGLIDRFEKKQLVKRQFAEGDRRKVIIVPDIDKIMALLAPLYADFRSASEQLLASFSAQEMQVIENYFVRAIELMNQETEKLNTQA